jgi:hypothetical protein
MDFMNLLHALPRVKDLHHVDVFLNVVKPLLYLLQALPLELPRRGLARQVPPRVEPLVLHRGAQRDQIAYLLLEVLVVEGLKRVRIILRWTHCPIEGGWQRFALRHRLSVDDRKTCHDNLAYRAV